MTLKRKSLPSFKVTTDEAGTIQKIARRAVSLATAHGIDADQMATVMDVTACHASGCPLQLGALLEADDFDFAHDVFGIARHLDRSTGKLTDCFVPRYASTEPR